MSLKKKNTFLKLLKILIVLLAWGFVIYKLCNSSEIEKISLKMIEFNKREYLLILVILLLMPINWLIEAIKWKYLIKPINNFNPLTALKAVWTGVTVGSITPNRIGEFGGRIMYINKNKRVEASALTLYGDLAQFLITFSIGLFSFLILIKQNFINHDIERVKTIILFGSIISLLLAGILYFYIEKFYFISKKVKILNKTFKRISNIENITIETKILTLSLSALRYFVFTSQFYLALLVFGINIPFYNAFIAISSIYIASTIIPNLPFLEIGVRLSFSIVFLGVFTDKIGEIILASTFIYLINVIIPIIFGGFFILRR